VAAVALPGRYRGRIDRGLGARLDGDGIAGGFAMTDAPDFTGSAVSTIDDLLPKLTEIRKAILAGGDRAEILEKIAAAVEAVRLVGICVECTREWPK
jgi:hypothetical protein